MINFQRPAFSDRNNFCNKHLYTKLLSQFRAVQSYRCCIMQGLVSVTSLRTSASERLVLDRKCGIVQAHVHHHHRFLLRQ